MARSLEARGGPPRHCAAESPRLLAARCLRSKWSRGCASIAEAGAANVEVPHSGSMSESMTGQLGQIADDLDLVGPAASPGMMPVCDETGTFESCSARQDLRRKMKTIHKQFADDLP